MSSVFLSVVAVYTRKRRRIAFDETATEKVLLSTHANRQGVDISFTVCLCVCLFVCTVTDFSAEDKATSSIKFCRAVHRRPRKGIAKKSHDVKIVGEPLNKNQC